MIIPLIFDLLGCHPRHAVLHDSRQFLSATGGPDLTLRFKFFPHPHGRDVINRSLTIRTGLQFRQVDIFFMTQRILDLTP